MHRCVISTASGDAGSCGSGRSLAGMQYQPSLDGLRAISVIAVILYHAGVTGVHGGFLGVEVFFVISGYLITALLIDEHGRAGRVDLRRFWARRARRLLPALAAMLAAVSAWVVLGGDAAQVDELRGDLPWAIGYAANWGQIVGDVPYFQPADPPLLRHLWSLAVEEQWYVLWPLAFLAVVRLPRGARATALVAAAMAAGALMWWVQRGAPGPVSAGGVLGWLDGADRVNVNYLSTVTRSLGLLLGAATAFVWRPWGGDEPRRARRRLDAAAATVLALLGVAFVVARVTDGAMYPWGLTSVSLLSAVIVAIAVHPGAVRTRAVLGHRTLVAVGRRSYGLYLWHWPVFVLLDATTGRWARIVPAMAIAVVLSEACYRWIELPIRERRWTWGHRPELRTLTVAATAVAALALGVAFVSADPYDPAAGGDAVAFELAPISAAPTVATVTSPATTPTTTPAAAPTATVGAAPATPATTTTSTTTTTTLPPAELPVDVAIVGDSQAHSLAINLPDGIESTFEIHDGSVDGCSIHDTGRVVSERRGFSNSFERCRGWHEEWAEAAADADVALVVIGAWDVFDIAAGDLTVPFASPAFDGLFTDNLLRGVDAMVTAGAHVGLLEVPCMRPQDVRGAGVPALPERGDDARIAHLNELLVAVADADPADAIEFVEGPDAWCDDEAIATDLAYRWDGVHVYRRGANLIYESIAPELLTIAARAAVE